MKLFFSYCALYLFTLLLLAKEMEEAVINPAAMIGKAVQDFMRNFAVSFFHIKECTEFFLKNCFLLKKTIFFSPLYKCFSVNEAYELQT